MKEVYNQKLHVLFLARWYPNRYDPMPGLFIQRHAEAVSEFCQVGVVYTHVLAVRNAKKFDIVFSNENLVLTARVYYKNPATNWPLITPLIKAFRFYQANLLGIRMIRKEMGKIDVFHVHILTRLGLIALFFKWFYHIPYIITEHWSRYLPLTGNFKGFFRKWATRLVVKHAEAVTTVTQNLATAMQSHGLKNKFYFILPNVVDGQFYQIGTEKGKSVKKTIVHVSCFEDKSKNISGILRVIKSLSQRRNDFVCKLIGDGMDYQPLKSYAVGLGLPPSVVQFTGLLEGRKLADEMASADLMIVFSNYENFPVVINESFVLGIPVIASAVGGIPEFVNDSNGKLIQAGNEEMLENCLIDFLDGHLAFKPEEISRNARSAYSKGEIGKMIFALYTKALKA